MVPSWVLAFCVSHFGTFSFYLPATVSLALFLRPSHTFFSCTVFSPSPFAAYLFCCAAQVWEASLLTFLFFRPVSFYPPYTFLLRCLAYSVLCLGSPSAHGSFASGFLDVSSWLGLSVYAWRDSWKRMEHGRHFMIGFRGCELELGFLLTWFRWLLFFVRLSAHG